MTTFGTYTPFLPFTLGRAVFQFDKAFHESRAVETSSLRGRKSIFLRARKRRETEISVRIALYTVSWNAHFRIHINVSELFVKIQPTLQSLSRISIQSRQQRLFTFSVVMRGRREWGEVSCEKSDGWPRDAVSHISWNILAILGRKEDFTMTLMGL